MKKLVEVGARTHALRYALITIMYFQIYYVRSSANLLCDTPKCRKLADYYKRNMNEQGKPCTDFYDYVCHNWGTQNPRPIHRALWNSDVALLEKATKNLKDILENEELNTSGLFKNSKALYRACINIPFMEKTGAANVKRVMAAAGNWPMLATKGSLLQNVPWWQIENYYISKTGESSIFDFQLLANTYMNSKITLFIFPPTSPYGMLKLYAPFHATHKKSYKAFLINVINTVAPFNIKDLASIIDKDLDDVIQFREEVAEISKVKFVVNGSQVMQMKDFQSWYNKQNSDQDTAKINWLAVARAMYINSNDPAKVMIENTTEIIVELPYMPKIAGILGKTPKRVIENHIHLYFAERHLKLNPQMESYLNNSVIGGINPTGKVRHEPERWAKCVNDNNLVTTLGYMYINSYFPMQNKQEVQELLKEEIQVFKTRILESSWLDVSTKNKMIRKLDNVRSQIGYPDWYSPVESMIPHHKQDVNPITPNAFFLRHFNRISVSAAYLQLPSYTPNVPYPIKYGATGFVLGHELHHGFDFAGLQYDENGSKNNNWLPENMATRYFEHEDCIEEQYTKYRKGDIKKHHSIRAINDTIRRKTTGAIMMLPQHDTTDEDVADVMGLKIAYMGYKKKLQQMSGTCPLLPGFDKFSCDKLFFIAFGNLFCANSTPSANEKLVLGDTHSFPPTRVNGAVGNMKEFHQAFGCKPSDPIVPKEICDIWK